MRSMRQVGFLENKKERHTTIGHFFTLRVTIYEAQARNKKISCCVVGFCKTFNIDLWEKLTK